MAHQSREADILSAWKAIAATAEVDGWRIIPIGTDARLQVGIRFPERLEVFVAGFDYDTTDFRSIPQGRGFSVEHVPLDETPGFQTWISVTRRSGASPELFIVMINDLIGTLEQQPSISERHLYYRFLGRIRSWQHFMEKPSDGRLSEEEELGLVGELLVLRHLIDEIGADAAIGLWKGPENSLQDFRNEAVGLEVKTTTSVNGFPVKISSLEQLDGMGNRQIYLTGIRLFLSGNGETLTELITSIRRFLSGSAAAQSRFERLLLLAGYLDASDQPYLRRFEKQSDRLFTVEVGFPRINRSEIALAILDAEYRIDLDEVEAAFISPDTIPSLFGKTYDDIG